MVLPVRVLTKLQSICVRGVLSERSRDFVTEEESGELGLQGRLTSALYGESLLVFMMLLRVGIYMAYWLWLEMCCNLVGEMFNSKRLMGVCGGAL